MRTALVALGLLAGPPGCLRSDLEPLDDPAEELDVEGQPLGGTNLAGVNLAGTNLNGANLAGTNLNGANLAGPNLGGTNLGGTNLAGTNLNGANLTGNNLGGTNLAGTNLNGANLAGTNLNGANLNGANLGGTNLNGANLAGAYAGLGCPVAAATNLGTDLTVSTIGTDIHGPVANDLLMSGEDLFTESQSCVVLGIGSTALARLIAQNSTGATMYAGVKQLPWGFAVTSGGAATLTAWEVVVWGTSRYAVFIVAAPPGTSWAGVAGFVKAVFRWSAPTTMTLRIGQIGGGQPVQTHTGMMNAGTHVLAGTISETHYILGEMAFINATTNSVAVNVDFASWVAQASRGNDPLVLGNVEGTPVRADAVYEILAAPDGTFINHIASFGSPASDSVTDGIEMDSAWRAGLMGRPVAKRCFAARVLEGIVPPPAVPYAPASTKCDVFGLSSDMRHLNRTSPGKPLHPDRLRYDGPAANGWDSRGGGAGPVSESQNGVVDLGREIPESTFGCTSSSPGYTCLAGPSGYYCRCGYAIVTQTYVHLNEPPYAVDGEGLFLTLSAPTTIVAGLNTPFSLTATVTNIGTVPSSPTGWSLIATGSSVTPTAPTTTAPASIASLAVGASRTYTVTARRTGTTGAISVRLRKGTRHINTISRPVVSQ